MDFTALYAIWINLPPRSRHGLTLAPIFTDDLRNDHDIEVDHVAGEADHVNLTAPATTIAAAIPSTAPQMMRTAQAER